MALISPHNLTMRMLAEAPVLGHLAKQDDLEVVVLSPIPSDEAKAASYGLAWRKSSRPTDSTVYLERRGVLDRMKGTAHHLVRNTLLRRRAEYENIRYRFLDLMGFRAHQDRKRMPRERREADAARSKISDPKYGWPLPKNWHVFRLLYSFYYSTWQHNDIYIESFFEEFQPHLVVLTHVQNEMIQPYVVAARRRKIPILGVVASWDQPTTAGAMVPGISHFIVNSQVMRQHLKDFHGVEDERIEVVGFPQMDVYRQKLQSREAFFSELGIPLENKLLVLASYPERWVKHYEPDLLRYLEQQLQHGAYEFPCTLIIRPHPIDSQAKERLAVYHQPPQIFVEDPDLGHLDHLANLMCHADVILTPASSLALDAIALDTPVVNIAIDGGGDVDYYESSQRWYEWDHYKEVVRTGGTTVVRDYGELDRAICDYLQSPDHNHQGRERLRQWMLEPLDGNASQRFAEVVIRIAKNKPLQTSPHQYPWLRKPRSTV